MKKLLYICLLMPFVFQSCKKGYSPGDNYPIVDVVPPYAAFKSTAAIKIDKPKIDTMVKFSFIIRTALQQAVTVTYSSSGAVTLANKTVVIARNTTSVLDSIPIPKGTTATTTLTLNKAVAADGMVFGLGANNVASSQKVNITVNP